MDTKLIVSASPHVRSEETTQSLMANVIVALCPCCLLYTSRLYQHGPLQLRLSGGAKRRPAHLRDHAEQHEDR